MNSRNRCLQVQDLSLNFGGLKVLDSISFTLMPGEVLGLVGPNGAGKSALLNCISGIYTPTSQSRIFFDGESLMQRSVTTGARLGIKRTFQHIHLVESLTVLDNVLVGLAPHFKGGVLRRYALFWSAVAEENRARCQALEALELCGIAHLAYELAASQPLGVRRRIDLARALVSMPSLLLLDEPASGLSTEERQLVQELVAIAHSKQAIAVMWIEHDLDLVFSAATRVFVLHHGRVIAEGDPRRSPEEREAMIQAYLRGTNIKLSEAHT